MTSAGTWHLEIWQPSCLPLKFNMATSSRAMFLFFVATIFVVDQAFALSSYEAESESRKRAALANELDDNRDLGDVSSLRRYVKGLAGDVVAMRRSLRDMRSSEPNAFNTGMGQMQENEMQMQLMLDTDDLLNGGNLGQYPSGVPMNGLPNSNIAGYNQQPQFSPYQQYQQPNQAAVPYGYPPNPEMPMNPMGMRVGNAYSNSPKPATDHQMEAVRRLLNGNAGSPELWYKPQSGSHPGPHHGRSLHTRSALPGNGVY